MAEALFARRLGEAGIDATVHSAGLLYDGESPPADGIEVMAALGIDTSGHKSRRMNQELLRDADLVVGMAKEHVREAVLLVPDTWSKAFTLKEIVRRGEAVGARRSGQTLGEWVTSLHVGRTRVDMLGAAVEDDVADPIGRKRSFYDQTAAELDDLTARLAKLVAG
ncbi:MAG: protein-tyrosine phosphatase [Actinomycetota bacterium]|nr:protein-tyrosine phosphatase [Actinomycetota bacterium]